MPTTLVERPSRHASLLPAPRVLGGRYRVVRAVGCGGMGTVYEATNVATGRRVAVKVLRPELASEPAIVARFTQEARAASRVEHPNVVQVLDLGADRDGVPFIVQEYLTGEDLGRHLERVGRLGVHDALAVMVPIVGGLAAAHEQGVVHRDIKPENIVLARGVDGDVVPKLIDFGISKLIDPGSAAAVGPKMTVTGAPLGTPQYMSPEQVRGDVALDGRADIWSVGAVLYELLAGVTPFQAPSYNLLVLKILTEDAPRIESLAPNVPAALAEVIHRALARDRAARYPTMRAFLAALASCAPWDSTAPEPAPPSAPCDPRAATARTSPDAAASDRPTLESVTVLEPARALRTRALGGLAVGALAALVAAGLVALRGHSGPADAGRAVLLHAPAAATALAPLASTTTIRPPRSSLVARAHEPAAAVAAVPAPPLPAPRAVAPHVAPRPHHRHRVPIE